MSAQGATALPSGEEQDPLRERLARLEDEVARLRRVIAESNPQGSPLDDDLDYKDIFDQISTCMFLIDVTPDGRFRYARFNPAEEQTVGLSTADVAGKLVEEVFTEDLARKLIGNYRHCVEAGTTLTYDDDLPLPGGRKYFHSNLIPVRNTAGRIHRLIGACIDITAYHQAQEEVLARQKLESLGVLAAGIAHDFNNFIGSIVAEAELGKSVIAAGAQPDEALQTIQEIATRAGEIVRELLTYVGQDAASVVPIDLSVLVDDMLGLLKLLMPKHATLTVDLPPNLPAVRANPVQLRQVVMNLIMNAAEALGDHEGTITVSTVGVHDQDAVGNRLPTPSVRLTVRDTGAGMTPEVLSRIFDPFFSTKVAGRGMGLAVVQGIIRNHNGKISVMSVPGQGSSFDVLLPCTTDTTEP